jgi:integrase
LTVEEFCSLTPFLKDPFRTMVMVALCLGLRVSEIMALKWDDFDFGGFALLVQRSVVHGRVDEVKTEYSHDRVPLDERLAEVLMEWKAKSPLQQADDWVFSNPATGRPYHQEEILKNHIKPAPLLPGLVRTSDGHTFRHTYRSLLDETGAPMKVQQELMRHASIETTMNVYGQAMPASSGLPTAKWCKWC